VAGAFVISDRAACRVKDRNILLIDDVMTTGATLEACCRVLKAAGAKRVDVLTLSRVISPREAAP
jgi:predicted amidophosphoribosyltransferase